MTSYLDVWAKVGTLSICSGMREYHIFVFIVAIENIPDEVNL